MLAFSVLTPYYNEEVIFSKHQLKEENEDGVTILFYLQRIFPGTVRMFYKPCNHNITDIGYCAMHIQYGFVSSKLL